LTSNRRYFLYHTLERSLTIKAYGNTLGGDISLDNLNVVSAIYAPANMFTGPKWKLALYVDNKASEQQKDVLTKIFSGQVGVSLELLLI